MKTIQHPRLLTESIRALERSGRYRQAFQELSHIWPDINKEPETTGLSKAEKAEVLLRCGTLAGFLGRMDNSLSAQESSKNLLTTARELFLDLEDEANLVEAENGLAMAYLRKGEFNEAQAWIESSFEHDLSTDHFARIESFIFKALILIDRKRYQDALEFLRKVEPFFQRFDDDLLNGCFCANLGIALRNLDRRAEAMQMYNLARHFHREAGNVIYLATIENNLSYLYKHEKRYALAHECVDFALELYKEAGDISRLGFSYDTKALIFLEERRLEEAIQTVDKGLEILRKSEITDFLVETLFTKIRIQVERKDLASAAITFSEAADLVREVQGLEMLATRAAEFEDIVKGGFLTGLGRILTEKVIPGEELELELSPSLSAFANFDAVWIRTQQLESVGLKKGNLALVVDEEVMDGDVVALVEKGSEEVRCGFMEEKFGLISLSTDRVELEVFKADSVEIFGKIVGYANPEDRNGGKLIVKPLKTES